MSATSGAEPFYPSLAFTEGVSIVVAEDELERANAILAAG